ncbi:MAG: hypothetical protein OXI46_08925 [Gemmatimonadota bacterium]|nr:hypothetical protein [Gemmatimonadota bacterium]
MTGRRGLGGDLSSISTLMPVRVRSAASEVPATPVEREAEPFTSAWAAAAVARPLVAGAVSLPRLRAGGP